MADTKEYKTFDLKDGGTIDLWEYGYSCNMQVTAAEIDSAIEASEMTNKDEYGSATDKGLSAKVYYEDELSEADEDLLDGIITGLTEV